MKLLYLVESGESKFLVFDEMSDKISTKYGDDTIIGRIGGIFYDFLAKRNERREAFGGRKFDVVLDNGEVEKCEGQWWDAVTDRAREEYKYECLGGLRYKECIPYQGNEHLLGTNKSK